MATTNFKEKEREAEQKNAKARKKRRRKKRIIGSLIAVLIVSLVSICILSLTVFFKIEKINVVGSTVYTAEEIISAADIGVGDNLVLIFDNKISEKLVKNLPFIDGVEIVRKYPNSLEIKIKETKEELCFASGNNCFSANRNGKILKKYDVLPENLIMVTVSSDISFSLGENIGFKSEREAELFKNYMGMIYEYDYDVNFINISDPFTSYMKIEDRMIVKFGSSSYFENKAAYLSASLMGVSQNAEGIFDLSAWTPDNNKPVLTYTDISGYEK